MRELLTKDRGLYRPSVIKKSAAIFLLITTTFIGSIPSTVYAQTHTDGMIAANPTVLYIEHKEPVSNLLGLPRPVYNTLFDMPVLDTDPLANFIRRPETILGTVSASDTSHIPSLTGIITSAFGWRRHPVRGRVRHHNGIDIAAKLGTPVLAPASGRVIFSGYRRGYGNVIEIDHENGYTTLLAHNSRLLVNEGDRVVVGMEIAKAGRTGIATGVHVHVEVRKEGKLINPIRFFTRN